QAGGGARLDLQGAHDARAHGGVGRRLEGEPRVGGPAHGPRQRRQRGGVGLGRAVHGAVGQRVRAGLLRGVGRLVAARRAGVAREQEERRLPRGRLHEHLDAGDARRIVRGGGKERGRAHGGAVGGRRGREGGPLLVVHHHLQGRGG